MAIETGSEIDGKPRRAEQSRARYPDETGVIERDGVRVHLGALRRRRADDPAPADLVDRPFPALEGPDRRPGAAVSGS